jgi:hypothetical protein
VGLHPKALENRGLDVGESDKLCAPAPAAATVRKAEVLLSKGSTVGVVCREIEISEHTYYRWRRD